MSLTLCSDEMSEAHVMPNIEIYAVVDYNKNVC